MKLIHSNSYLLLGVSLLASIGISAGALHYHRARKLAVETKARNELAATADLKVRSPDLAQCF